MGTKSLSRVSLLTSVLVICCLMSYHREGGREVEGRERGGKGGRE